MGDWAYARSIVGGVGIVVDHRCTRGEMKGCIFQLVYSDCNSNINFISHPYLKKRRTIQLRKLKQKLP